MLNINDLIIYSGHGICRVDDISEKTFAGITRTYYTLHPIENDQDLTINVPVDNSKMKLFKLIDKKEANEIIALFNFDGIEWIDKPQQRTRVYSEALKTGNREEIAKIAITLILKKYKAEKAGKKLYENDKNLLIDIQNILFKELAIALDISSEAINHKINRIIREKNKLA
ncbi:CarD family transcriptional regulator [Virgibacillus doumboii]|uniref:CarD family transcriptional regulator n=1 Tax=Virgibacillus doumboii TaxID=2697503 RepID=UPI0013DEC85D|nr:CarD family transcriptional regulator [Virgibacillus doumboii]